MNLKGCADSVSRKVPSIPTTNVTNAISEQYCMKNLLIIFTVFFVGCIPDTSKENISVVNPKIKEWTQLNNKEKIGSYFKKNENIYCGQVQFNDYAMKEVDIKTFQVYAGTEYAKDINRVYYPIKIKCVDGNDFGVCYCTEYVMKGVEPENFTVLRNGYAKDNKLGYFKGQPIKDSDGMTFKIIDSPSLSEFATDKNHVYLYSNIIENADPNTFMYDDKNPQNDTLINKMILRDKDNIWEYYNGQLEMKENKTFNNK